MKVYTHPPSESWIVDRYVREWREHNQDISTLKPQEADIIWLMADWSFDQFPLEFLKSKKVLTTCFHIIPEQQGEKFLIRDSITDLYHASCMKTKDALVDAGATKSIITELIWSDNSVWFDIDKTEARKHLDLSQNSFIIGSFQRDTQGHDLVSPKLIKGPDIFCDYVEKFRDLNVDKNIEVLLGAWRRQYVISRLEKAGISYIYKELADEKTLNLMYNALDLYVVGSRLEGGPDSIYNASMSKTPIISTDVGIAPEILNQKSIAKDFSADSLMSCVSDVVHAYEIVKKLTIDKHKNKFVEILNRCLN